MRRFLLDPDPCTNKIITNLLAATGQLDPRERLRQEGIIAVLTPHGAQRTSLKHNAAHAHHIPKGTGISTVRPGASLSERKKKLRKIAFAYLITPYIQLKEIFCACSFQEFFLLFYTVWSDNWWVVGHDHRYRYSSGWLQESEVLGIWFEWAPRVIQVGTTVRNESSNR